MRRIGGASCLALAILVIGGCSVRTPTYETVRQDATQSLEEIAALIPPPRDIVPEPERPPYPCDDPLLLSQSDGSFYTGQWAVYVPAEFDASAFVADLPDKLGARWERRESGITVSFANVDLVQTESGVRVSVQEITIDGRRALDLIAISRCGTVGDAHVQKDIGVDRMASVTTGLSRRTSCHSERTNPAPTGALPTSISSTARRAPSTPNESSAAATPSVSRWSTQAPTRPMPGFFSLTERSGSSGTARNITSRS